MITTWQIEGSVKFCKHPVKICKAQGDVEQIPTVSGIQVLRAHKKCESRENEAAACIINYVYLASVETRF